MICSRAVFANRCLVLIVCAARVDFLGQVNLNCFNVVCCHSKSILHQIDECVWYFLKASARVRELGDGITNDKSDQIMNARQTFSVRVWGCRTADNWALSGTSVYTNMKFLVSKMLRRKCHFVTGNFHWWRTAWIFMWQNDKQNERKTNKSASRVSTHEHKICTFDAMWWDYEIVIEAVPLNRWVDISWLVSMEFEHVE